MFEIILRDRCGLDPQKPTLAGISGGPDSLCLLELLHTTGYQVIVAHFNHQLRPEADLEAGAVSEREHSLGVPFITDTMDVHAYAREQGLSLEEAARILRYRFLFAAARKSDAQAVAVGHTADDQVETVLMHFLRGAGLSGLKGMEYRTLLPVFDAEIPVVRPLLSFWRADTEAYCRDKGLQPHFDASNADQRYLRNRLRHALIPELEKYNPRFKESLLRTAQALQGDHSALQEVLDGAWKEIYVESGDGWVAFDQDGLAKLPHGLRRNLIRRAAESLRPDNRDFGFEALERASAFAEVLFGKRVDFVNGLYLFSETGKIYLAAYEADLPSAGWPQVSQPYVLNGPRLELAGGWLLTVDQVDPDKSETVRPHNNWSVWLDADQVAAEPLIVRPRRAGDQFSPLGMASQTIKLREFFINVKLPRRARADWPLVCAGERIVWVPGFRLAHPFRITDQTRHALHLEIKRLPET